MTTPSPADSATDPRIDQYAAELYSALRERRTLPRLMERDPSLTIEDAYAISLNYLGRRLRDGETVVGKKIGLTSQVTRDQLGVYQPDFGFLTDWMRVDGDTIDIDRYKLIQPQGEAEIAFVLKDDLNGPGISADDVLAATDYIAPCFEIVDSRIHDWKFGIVDTVADNASCGVFVIADARGNPRDFDLETIEVTVRNNGREVGRGVGAAALGSPLNSVAWLANTLGEYGVSLNKGDVILSGSLVPLIPAVKGDVFESDVAGLGRCTVRFV
ncbi:fumarylacetoacetate hydrolase family protein [Streptomyces sp. NPDC002888]|uniref:fumarylacetoacetate hydrolase family protein n=1 Tax=Streptomyces sp. NPDC002888 TaxID=3364668 RepID=UPI0036B50051